MTLSKSNDKQCPQLLESAPSLRTNGSYCGAREDEISREQLDLVLLLHVPYKAAENEIPATFPSPELCKVTAH
jgi:hypothetical protein